MNAMMMNDNPMGYEMNMIQAPSPTDKRIYTTIEHQWVKNQGGKNNNPVSYFIFHPS